MVTALIAAEQTAAGVVTVLFPTIASALRLASGELGLLAAGARLASTPFGPLWVWTAQRTSRRLALALSCALCGLATIAGGFSTDFGHLLVATVLAAVCTAGVGPIASAIVSDSFPDAARGRAFGVIYGVTSLTSAVAGPLLALLSGFSSGWRIAMWTLGAMLLVGSAATWAVFRDPGVAAAEPAVAGLPEHSRGTTPVTWTAALGLFAIPTYRLLMVSRLLSAHLLVTVFGVQFLVTERGFSNAQAAWLLVPYGVGYAGGAVLGGRLLGVWDRHWPAHGRVAQLQAAQVLFAGFAFCGTQLVYDEQGVYFAFGALMGAAQGLNPVTNRPLVAAVVAPELRGQAFAIMSTVIETAGWVVFSVTAGALASRYGLESVFWWLLVVLMLVNAAWLSGLHRTYPRDRARLESELARRGDTHAPDHHRTRTTQ